MSDADLQTIAGMPAAPVVPAFRDVLYSVTGHVATITMNRPHRRNALSGRLVNELIVAFETAGADATVGAVILQGAGGAFCSGGDLSQMSGGAADDMGDVPLRGGFVELNLAFTTLGKPVIAKIHRYAYGGGLGLVAASHFAIAEDTAKFGTPEIDRGVFPMMIMAWIFRNVPRRKGLEMILTGDRITAAEAAEYGLINRAVPAEDLDTEAQALAEKLASKPPAIVRLGLEAYHRQDDLTAAEALPYLSDMLMKCFGTDDAHEGMSAFLEKREPVWWGRS
jgi:enoyl-CoA hydratase/carnithine racemase